MLRHVKQGLSKRPSLTAWIHFLRGVYHRGSRMTAIFLAGQWGPLDLMQAWRATRPRSSVQLQLLPLWWNRKSGSKVMTSWRCSRLRVGRGQTCGNYVIAPLLAREALSHRWSRDLGALGFILCQAKEGNFARWRFSNQWSNREVLLLLVENSTQCP